MESNVGRIFGVADTPAAFLEEDWREVPRSEMLLISARTSKPRSPAA
jgi:hypothetical protein